jgi:hypothetical protein
MAITRCTLSTLKSRAISALNAGTAATYGTTVADDRRSSGEIEAAILASDARVCRARASNPADELLRPLLLSLSASITHAGAIPEHLGPVEQVLIKHASADSDYKAGKTDDSLTLADIENWRAYGSALYGAAHNAAGAAVAGFYLKRGNQLFYTGYDAKVYLATFTRSGACQAPDIDEDTVLGLALEDLIKEGDTGSVVATLIQAARTEYARLEGAQAVAA